MASLIGMEVFAKLPIEGSIELDIPIIATNSPTCNSFCITHNEPKKITDIKQT